MIMIMISSLPRHMHRYQNETGLENNTVSVSSSQFCSEARSRTRSPAESTACRQAHTCYVCTLELMHDHALMTCGAGHVNVHAQPATQPHRPHHNRHPGLVSRHPSARASGVPIACTAMRE